MKASEVLARAKEVLLEHGMAKGILRQRRFNQRGEWTGEYSYCSVGAIAVACDTMQALHLTPKEPLLALIEAITGKPSHDPLRIATFNDHHTEGAVLDMFDRAILIAKEKYDTEEAL